MLIYRNAEGVHGQRKFGNSCFRKTLLLYFAAMFRTFSVSVRISLFRRKSSTTFLALHQLIFLIVWNVVRHLLVFYFQNVHAFINKADELNLSRCATTYKPATLFPKEN